MAGSDFVSGGASGGGFLSRVAKLVKGGQQATNWSDLDQRVASSAMGGGEGQGQDVAYSKQALKDMMERKRHNDFVRKREFEMLRKIRRRARGMEGDTSLRPSFFVSSMNYSRPANEREQTLKKINDIEEQMSQQWWQAKHGSGNTGNAPLGAAGGASAAAASAAPPSATQAGISQAYAKTAPVGLMPEFDAAIGAESRAEGRVDARDLQGKTGSSPLETLSSSAVVSLNLQSADAAASPAGAVAPSSLSSSDFSPSREYSAEVQEVVHDPELEEAAILFANGEDEAAEAALSGWDPSGGATYYFNPATATSPWIWSRTITGQIGNHLFGF